ncbi:MAG: Mut7-C ubiquitin/RNAse domain-containing protein [Chromatiales bacterium]|nr:Mut7-C ubiquitin/RNAse domain-containing protein [Chromatiales bacterium]
MPEASFRVYEELNDYLPAARRKRDFPVRFPEPCPVRHLIGNLGIPPTEVEIVLRNGESVGWSEQIRDGDRVSVYPVFESLDVSSLLKLRPEPLRNPRFYADAQLGRLARWLRLLGFDTRYDNCIDDADLVRAARDEQRIILSRDRDLLIRREVTHGCHIRETRPWDQLLRVVRRCDLYGQIRPFSRCMVCNGLSVPVDKASIENLLPENTRETFQAYWRCQLCGKIYWKGGHFERLQARISTLLQTREDAITDDPSQ